MCGDSQRKRGVGRWRWAKGETGERKTLRQWAHHAGADDVLLSCTLETCMGFQTNVTPINSIEKKSSTGIRKVASQEEKATHLSCKISTREGW